MDTDPDLRMLDEWLHGRLSEEDFVVMQRRLNESAELRSELRAMADLDEALRQAALQPFSILTQNSASHEQPAAVGHRSVAIFPWSIAFVAALVAAMAWLPYFHAKRVDAGKSLTALLVDEAGAEFAPARAAGEVQFPPGRYALKRGAVHLRYANGADLVVQGPADFEICDGMHTRLESGVVRAIVPPTAHGFTLLTKDVSYEDVGTEFGLRADSSTGQSEMLVFDGQVNVRGGRGTEVLKSVFEGDAVRFNEGKIEADYAVDSRQFPSPAQIGYLRWSGSRDEMLADPDLVAWFPFMRAENPSLLVNAQRSNGVADGRIAGARWTVGRWAGKQALWFDRDSDFAEIELPGAYQEMSVAVWMKVDRFESSMSAILNSNEADSGDFHFQFNRQGLPRGGVLGFERANQQWVGNPVPAGKWVHVVSVLSFHLHRHVIYVNGDPVFESDILSSSGSVSPGVCRIGNWLPDSAPQNSEKRALRGWLDEIAIWNRALSRDEVIRFMERGRPSQLWNRSNPALNMENPKARLALHP
jgi:hypothetical protein